MTTLLTGVNGGTFPNQTTGPAAGEFITAASVNNGLQGVLNECKYLYDTKANLAGATFTGLVTCNAGLTISGSILNIAVGATFDCDGTFGTSAAAFFNGTTEATASFEVSGTLLLTGRTRNRGIEYPSDADQTLVSATAEVYKLAENASAGPAVTRVIKLQTTTVPVPLEGEQIRVCGHPVNGTGPGGYQYNLQREDGTNIAQMYGAGPWVLCQFDGGVWVGICHSGGDSADPTKGYVAVGAGWT